MAMQEEFKTQGDKLFRYRSYLPLIILVVGLLVLVAGKQGSSGTDSSTIYCVWTYIALAVGLFGLLIRIYTVGHTPKNTSGRNTREGQVADELNTTGIYSLVRHPLYVGNFFMWLGVAMLTADAWFIVAFVLFYWLYYERIMYAEESFLRGKFGQTYLDWAKGVPAFVPSFKGFEKPKYPFSIKKVLKKEKNGFAALFVLFWIFDLVGRWAAGEPLAVHLDFWFYAAVASVVIYFILKIMKNRGVLNEATR